MISDISFRSSTGAATAGLTLPFGKIDNGEGISQDVSEAAQWYRRAAEQGDAYAQLNLGLMYDLSEGVPQNYS